MSVTSDRRCEVFHLTAPSAQAKTITKLEATVKKRGEELREIKTPLGPEWLGRQLYSDTLHRVLSPASGSSTATTFVDKISPVETMVRLRPNEDGTTVTINTTRVKKENQDTVVMRETLDRSLGSFQVTEDIAIECIRLRHTDIADVVFYSVNDKDRAREHPRRLAPVMPEARVRVEQGIR
jgi:hypothetical protein